MSFEPVVRPFQDRPVAPPFLILDEAKPEEAEEISYGKNGGTTFSFSYSFSGEAKSKNGDSWKETSRKSQTIRITNPDDEEQFVDSKRATEINYNDTKTGKQKRSYKFNYPDDTSV